MADLGSLIAAFLAANPNLGKGKKRRHDPMEILGALSSFAGGMSKGMQQGQKQRAADANDEAVGGNMKAMSQGGWSPDMGMGGGGGGGFQPHHSAITDMMRAGNAGPMMHPGAPQGGGGPSGGHPTMGPGGPSSIGQQGMGGLPQPPMGGGGVGSSGPGALRPPPALTQPQQPMAPQSMTPSQPSGAPAGAPTHDSRDFKDGIWQGGAPPAHATTWLGGGSERAGGPHLAAMLNLSPQDRFVGDSIGVGMGQGHGDISGAHVGHSPTQILDEMRHMQGQPFKGHNVFISGGASNAVGQQPFQRGGYTDDQLREAIRLGADPDNVMFYGVGPGGGGQETNDVIRRFAEQGGAHFQPLQGPYDKQGVHPSYPGTWGAYEYAQRHGHQLSDETGPRAQGGGPSEPTQPGRQLQAETSRNPKRDKYGNPIEPFYPGVGGSTGGGLGSAQSGLNKGDTQLQRQGSTGAWATPNQGSSGPGYNMPRGTKPQEEQIWGYPATAVQNAIASRESDPRPGYGYDAQGNVVRGGPYAGERAQGRYQIMPGNLPGWSHGEFKNTPEDLARFRGDKAAQDRIFNEQMHQYPNIVTAARKWLGEGGPDVNGMTAGPYSAGAAGYLRGHPGSTYDQSSWLGSPATPQQMMGAQGTTGPVGRAFNMGGQGAGPFSQAPGMAPQAQDSKMQQAMRQPLGYAGGGMHPAHHQGLGMHQMGMQPHRSAFGGMHQMGMHPHQGLGMHPMRQMGGAGLHPMHPAHPLQGMHRAMQQRQMRQQMHPHRGWGMADGGGMGGGMGGGSTPA